MLSHYLYWQYNLAPRWLLQLIWNFQIGLINIFSIPVMLKTLIAHWHKDAVGFHGGTPSQLLMVYSWNLISRFMGLIIRSSVIAVWLLVEAFYLPLALMVFSLFLLWPLLVIFSVPLGIVMALI